MKTSFRLFALLALFAHATLFAATKPSPDHFPLREGVEWRMDIEVTYPDGQRLRGGGRRVTGPAEVRDGKTYFRSRTWEEFEVQPRRERVKLVRKDANGLHSIDLSAETQKEEMEAALPLKVGGRWQTKHLHRMVLNHEVIAQETVVIGGKTYSNCFHIRTTATAGDYTEDFWEAPDVGLVKTVVTMTGAKVALTLREFKSGKTTSK